MAHKKAGGSTSLGRDSVAKRLGTKLFDGQFAKAGKILVRQRGLEIRPGENVRRGKDYTLFATSNGYVQFSQKKVKKFNGHLVNTKFISIIDKKPKQKQPAQDFEAMIEKQTIKATRKKKKPAKDRPLPAGKRKHRRQNT